jgi:hypothetical protein
MRTSEKIDLISKALVEAQKGFGSAIKGSKNPYFKSSYADMSSVVEAIKEPLNKAGIAYIQLVTSGEKDVVETILLHESGQFISTETKIYCTKPNDPQAFGSGITYTKRYALQAALGLPSEDDDGNAASQKTKEPVNKTEDKPVSLDPEQMDFIEKVRIMLEENLDGKAVDGPKLHDYFIDSSRRSGRPVPKDNTKVKVTAMFIMQKPEILETLKGN